METTKPQNNGEKAIYRQKNNINDVKEIVEKTLRELSKIEEVVDNTGKKFTAENKRNRLKELRQVMLNLKRREDFLVVAEKLSYVLAEKML